MRRKLGVDCDICGNTGFITAWKDGVSSAAVCPCMTEFYNKQRISVSGLARAFEVCTLENFKAAAPWQKAMKDKALEFLNADGVWFFIGGAVGCGKTHICTAICGELIKRRSVHYMPWRDATVPLKASVTDEEEYQRLIRRPKSADVLYIDDFFKGGHSEADVRLAFEIINHRYVNGLTTIISSEHSIGGILEIDEAVGSRINQMAEGFQLSVGGTDKNMRLKPAI
jgi:DNA replication protein DnaC